MRNRIDFTLPPEDLFHDPVEDPGFAFLSRPDFIWRPHPPGRIEGFCVSDHESIQIRTERFLRYTRQHKTFAKAVEFKTSLVMLTKASFRKSYAMARGKCLLNGAAGIRLLNRYCWENETSQTNPEDTLVRYFAARQSQRESVEFPVLTSSLPEGIDFAVECRNTFNFYHFITETLCHLCLLADTSFKGRVFVHFPNAEDKTRDFIAGFIDALFPEFAGRVVLERTPKDYDQVLTAYSMFNSLYFLPPSMIAGIDDLAPSDEMWKGATATRSSQAVLSMNSIDSSLIRLRERALKAVEGRDVSHLPRRFFAGRKPGASRKRDLGGENELLAVLKALGFAEIAFEDLSPLDQIALMANAEIMVSAHGAGFANMLFAHPDALCVELGTLQTAIHRWGDFWPLAIVSGCFYVSFFGDYNKDDPLTDPSFSQDGIVPAALGRRGLGTVLAFLAATVGRIPRLKQPDDVARLMQQLIRTGKTDRALELMAAHADLHRSSASLCIAAAELHRSLGQWTAELVSLTEAWEADPSRWQTLSQIIWCARKCGRTDVQTWAIRLMEEEFPDQCAEMVKDRAWMRELL